MVRCRGQCATSEIASDNRAAMMSGDALYDNNDDSNSRNREDDDQDHDSGIDLYFETIVRSIEKWEIENNISCHKSSNGKFQIFEKPPSSNSVKQKTRRCK
jgi:hypothetical protein